jgi:TRAP-type mannitol/chloroaromatic compound transport system permease small subunit
MMSDRRLRTGNPALAAVDSAMNMVSRTGMIMASVWIGALGLLICIDVAGRATGTFAFVGTVTVATESVVAISMLCMPYAMRHELHIRATLLVDRAGPRVSEGSLLASYVVAAALFLFLTYAAWGPFLDAWRTGDFSGQGGLSVILWPFKLIIVVCFAAMTVESVLNVAKSKQRMPSAPTTVVAR